MTEKANKEFPAEIFLKLETETNDEPYFVHYESAKDIAEPDTEVEVGVYRLAGTAKVTAHVSIKAEP